MIVLLLTISIINLSCQTAQDEWDQRALRKHFRIPGTFTLIEYDGCPPVVGFGQREGLEIRAVYRLTDKQIIPFVKDIRSHGWRTLPIPEEVRCKIRVKEMNMPLEAKEGYYVCKTAGDNVLHARETKPCDEVSLLNDLILGILEADEQRLSVIIWSGY